jgi:hypothetical protein
MYIHTVLIKGNMYFFDKQAHFTSRNYTQAGCANVRLLTGTSWLSSQQMELRQGTME